MSRKNPCGFIRVIEIQRIKGRGKGRGKNRRKEMEEEQRRKRLGVSCCPCLS